MSLLRSVVEIGFGLAFLAGAIFNAAYTLRHGDEFFGGFARSGWLGPARRIVRDVVIPNAAVFTVALVVFEAAVACLILTRGPLVGLALLAGGGFALLGALFSSARGAVVNLTLAALLFVLAATS